MTISIHIGKTAKAFQYQMKDKIILVRTSVNKKPVDTMYNFWLFVLQLH